MLVVADQHSLEVVGILPLARRPVVWPRVAPGLLHDLIGQLVTRQLVARDEIQPVIRREVALVVNREVAKRAAVGIVLRHHRVEVVVGLRPRGAESEGILSPGVRP